MVGGGGELTPRVTPRSLLARACPPQSTKLAASGVDIGSDMLFRVRLGFSGTPSDLLPLSLQPCVVEPGSDAEYIRVLSSQRFVR